MKIINVLDGEDGNIIVYDNNTISIRENNKPYYTKPIKELSHYIEKLKINNSLNGKIKLGVWDHD